MSSKVRRLLVMVWTMVWVGSMKYTRNKRLVDVQTVLFSHLLVVAGQESSRPERVCGSVCEFGGKHKDCGCSVSTVELPIVFENSQDKK